MGHQGEQPEMNVLTSQECYHMLAARHVGRLGVVADGYPLVIPVNYAVDRDVVVIRTEPGSVVAHADHGNVTFEVDEFDFTKNSGWSILIRGQAEALTAEHSKELIERTEASDVHPWAPGERNHWMRIIPHGISGRRIVSSDDLRWRLGTGAYM